MQGISTNQNFCPPWRSLPMSGWNYGENSIRNVKRHWQKDAIIMESSLPMRYRLAVGEMDYGLVWDGSGKDEIEGGLGEYLRYNNSHKCALYLASGIPVIVWSRSGMANFVREHACGITIDRLGDLDQAIHTADYEKLKEAALAVAPKLWEGYYLSQAIDSACG